MAEMKTIEITHNKTNNKKSQREKNKEHSINEKNKEQIPKEQIIKEIPKEIPKETKHRQNVNRQSVIENVLDRDRLYSIALPPIIKSTNK